VTSVVKIFIGACFGGLGVALVKGFPCGKTPKAFDSAALTHI